MEVFLCVGTSTKPAPLKTAEVASHVVAALHLFHFGLALGTVGDVLVVTSPLLKLLVLELVTGSEVSMPVVSALETNFGVALRTSEFLRVEVVGSHIPFAVGLGTPSNERVSFQPLLFLESVELLNEILPVSEQIPKLVFSHLLPALTLKTNELLHLHSVNAELKLLLHTLLAKLVVAGEREEEGLVLVLIADRAALLPFKILLLNLSLQGLRELNSLLSDDVHREHSADHRFIPLKL